MLLKSSSAFGANGAGWRKNGIGSGWNAAMLSHVAGLRQWSIAAFVKKSKKRIAKALTKAVSAFLFSAMKQRHKFALLYPNVSARYEKREGGEPFLAFGDVVKCVECSQLFFVPRLAALSTVEVVLDQIIEVEMPHQNFAAN